MSKYMMSERFRSAQCNTGGDFYTLSMTCSVKGILFNILGNTFICFLAVS